MKCHQCNLVDMRQMARNNEESVWQCPKCMTISKISIEEEQNILNQEIQENQEENNT